MLETWIYHRSYRTRLWRSIVQTASDKRLQTEYDWAKSNMLHMLKRHPNKDNWIYYINILAIVKTEIKLREKGKVI